MQKQKEKSNKLLLVSYGLLYYFPVKYKTFKTTVITKNIVTIKYKRQEINCKFIFSERYNSFAVLNKITHSVKNIIVTDIMVNKLLSSPMLNILENISNNKISLMNMQT